MSEPENNGIFHVHPWDPKTQTVAQILIKEIHTIAPGLEILFMGAAALGLPGKNDIDLDILCASQDVPHYAQQLVSVLGDPKELGDKLAAWSFYRDGIEVDAILSDPAISHVSKQRRNFEELQRSPQLLDAYKQFKLSCDGLPYSEYVQRKKAFFQDLENQRT